MKVKDMTIKQSTTVTYNPIRLFKKINKFYYY